MGSVHALDANWRSVDWPLPVGVSRCLLGDAVRYDGGHKRSPAIVEGLGDRVTWVPVCPEVELGMGTPRPPIRIVQPAGTEGEARQRLEGVADGQDHSAAMVEWARSRTAALAETICGFVLKSRSPSCGQSDVPVWSIEENGEDAASARGFFARVIMDSLPRLPFADEVHLQSVADRALFLSRVRAYARVERMLSSRPRAGHLIDFHTAHKMELLAHSEVDYRALGRLLADMKSSHREDVSRLYRDRFLSTMAKPPSRKRHVNVLQHMAGHLRGRADDGARRQIGEGIAAFASGSVDLSVPRGLILDRAAELEVPYLLDQTYLERDSVYDGSTEP